MIVGIGDSNLEFGGHGWAEGFGRLTAFRSLVSFPGGSSRDVLRALRGMPPDVIADLAPSSVPILVTLGINDMLQGVGPIEFARNHRDIMRLVEAAGGPRSWIWMPSHVTGHWKLEALRTVLCLYAIWRRAQFVNLRAYRDLTIYRFPDDPFHLQRSSYVQIARRVMQDMQGQG
ncbi:hypothetical protein [Roseovarius pacificus]|uniref:hypothetical protein n=1 Tax=Roseovarius pacificus TaxID=337701 RepID=UPI00403A6CFD